MTRGGIGSGERKKMKGEKIPVGREGKGQSNKYGDVDRVQLWKSLRKSIDRSRVPI